MGFTLIESDRASNIAGPVIAIKNDKVHDLRRFTTLRDSNHIFALIGIVRIDSKTIGLVNVSMQPVNFRRQKRQYFALLEQIKSTMNRYPEASGWLICGDFELDLKEKIGKELIAQQIGNELDKEFKSPVGNFPRAITAIDIEGNSLFSDAIFFAGLRPVVGSFSIFPRNGHGLIYHSNPGRNPWYGDYFSNHAIVSMKFYL